MKKVLLYSGVVLLMLAGCSSKSPAVDETKAAPTEQTETPSADNTASPDTVVVEDNNSAVSSQTEAATAADTMASLEKEMQTIYFAFDKYNITTEASDSLQANSALAQGKASAFNIKIEGNCDEWGSDEYNFALGLKRAKAAKDALVADGVDANRISLVSYGKSNPVCTEHTKDCWAKNRRDDFKLLP
jgi:peptidoglycan-associated lipoprotein